jgi:hypothetical protein
LALLSIRVLLLKKTVKYLDLVDGNLKIKDEYLYVQNSILVHFMEEDAE